MSKTLLGRYESQFNDLLEQSVYQVAQRQKETLLLPILNTLGELHVQNCEPYSNLFCEQHSPAESLEQVHYLAVRLFKHLTLSSVPLSDIFKTLHSSGTTGQSPAQIFLDKATSARQSKVLVKILQQSIGKKRLPMLIIDSPAVLKDKHLFSARGAGIQGLAFFGRDHTYALDENMQPDWQVIDTFAEKYRGQPVLVFGFTFMVWLYFVTALKSQNRTLNFDNGILLHSGGWKRLEAQKVDNASFKKTLQETCNITHVNNFYGMAEQIGSVFVECEEGHLHASVFADVITRNPLSLEPCEIGEQGILQVLSVLPTSYPGHSLLTEDLGTILGIDDCQCGRKGRYFEVSGRLPKTEVRGCSDTHQQVNDV